MYSSSQYNVRLGQENIAATNGDSTCSMPALCAIDTISLNVRPRKPCALIKYMHMHYHTRPHPKWCDHIPNGVTTPTDHTPELLGLKIPARTLQHTSVHVSLQDYVLAAHLVIQVVVKVVTQKQIHQSSLHKKENAVQL